jgi:hypothetical protein
VVNDGEVVGKMVAKVRKRVRGLEVVFGFRDRVAEVGKGK